MVEKKITKFTGPTQPFFLPNSKSTIQRNKKNTTKALSFRPDQSAPPPPQIPYNLRTDCITKQCRKLCKQALFFRPKLPISTNQQDIPQSNQIPFIASTKPSQVNMHPSTYPTVLGFTPQPFPYLATNPSWLSAKQQPYSNFSSYPTPLDYFRPPSAAVNFNTNFKVKPNARRNLENKNTPFQPLSCHQFQNQPWPPNNSAMGYFPEKSKFRSKIAIQFMIFLPFFLLDIKFGV